IVAMAARRELPGEWNGGDDSGVRARRRRPRGDKAGTTMGGVEPGYRQPHKQTVLRDPELFRIAGDADGAGSGADSRDAGVSHGSYRWSDVALEGHSEVSRGETRERDHGGKVKDLSLETTHTAMTRVLWLCSACAGSSGLGMGEYWLMATA